ncbi:MAG: ATPase, partial [Flavobacterium sp.]|nr:ATPase [Flavobacterium sp.]
LAKDKHPNTTEFECKEIYKFVDIDYHVAIIYKSDDEESIQKCLDEAADKITDHILNIIPPQNRPTS